MGVDAGIGEPDDSNVGTMLIANAFHVVMGMVFLALGAAVLLDTAILLAASDGAVTAMSVAVDLGVAVGLVVLGAAHLCLSVRQRSYRFRGDALSLAAPPAHPISTRDERKARARDYLRMLVRTGVKAPPAPAGVVGAFVQSVAPRLNLAQAPIRLHAYRQLRRALDLSLILVAVTIAWVIAGPAVFTAMAATCFVAAVLVLRPDEVFRLRGPVVEPGEEPESTLPHPARALVLLAAAVLAPAGLSYLVAEGIAVPPAWLGRLEGLGVPVLVVVLAALAGCALYAMALARQTRDLEESAGSSWGSTQPYALPEVSQGFVRHIYERLPAAGTLLSWRFDKRAEALYAGFLAEGEATLAAGEEADSLAAALSDAWNAPSSRALLVLHGFGLLLGLLACVFAWMTASLGGVANAAMAVGLVAVAQACMSAALKLWKRADFVSLVYEVDIEATYLEQAAASPGRIHVGGARRQLASGNVRVRVLRMHSVQFEPHGQRFVTGIALDISESTRLATAVEDYHRQVLPNDPTPPVGPARALA